MTIEEYKSKIQEIGFEENPYFIHGGKVELYDFIDYDNTNIELKIHLAKVIICRSFPDSNGIYLPSNVDWFINNFFITYKKDLIKPWITTTIIEAFKMIMSDDSFGKCIIGTTFMFGIIEFYAKYKIGFSPFFNNFNNNEEQKKFKHIFIGEAFFKLKKIKSGISRSINEIDKLNKKRYSELGIVESNYTFAKIGERLPKIRNIMLHGEEHSFYSIGKYLLMLYILFHLNEEMDIK